MKHVRLYQNAPLKINDTLQLDDYGSHHLTKVLRFPEGQDITLFNGDGNNYTATVLSAKKHCEVQIHSAVANQSESRLALTLELGVNQIVPIFTKHCMVRLKGDKLKKRKQHWQKIIIGACEQSGRSVVPKLLEPLDFNQFIEQDFGNKFVLHHRAEQSLLDVEPLSQATIIIGPEGGLSDDEIQLAIEHNAQPLLLGSRVLRTETASLAALANMQLLWGS